MPKIANARGSQHRLVDIVNDFEIMTLVSAIIQVWRERAGSFRFELRVLFDLCFVSSRVSR